MSGTVPAGFDWAAVPDLDPSTIGQAEIEAAYRMDLPAHHRTRPPVVCRRNCRENPGCLVFLGETLWWREEEETGLDHDPEREPGVPAGLRNLGNTCYVNSLLQIWFNTGPFRQALLDWEPAVRCRDQEKVASLQALFTLMQFSDRKFVDPSDLVQKLGLNPAVQQDAQEFSVLFFSLLEEVLSHQTRESVRTMIQSQYRGKLSYNTKCLNCGQESQRIATYTQLDLTLEGNKSVADCLEHFTRTEVMTGEERYHCDQCSSKQEATRSCRLASLPPVLNLQLNRFQYDLKQGNKIKIFSAIDIPLQLDLSPYLPDSDSKYSLTGVLVHVGHANQGHYIAHVKDKDSGTWFRLSDEQVTRVEEEKVLERSENVYLMVYRRQEEEKKQESLPEHLKDIIVQDMKDFQSEKTDRQEDLWRERMAAIVRKNTMQFNYRQLYYHQNSLQPPVFLPLDWIKNWLASPDDCGPIETEDLLCRHGQLSLEKLHEVKRVKAETAARLYQEHGAGPGPRLSSDSFCRTCVVTTARLVSLQARMRVDQDLLASESCPVDGRGFWLGRESERRWRLLARRGLEREIQREEEHRAESGRKRKRYSLRRVKEKFLRLGTNVTISVSSNHNNIIDQEDFPVTPPMKEPVKEGTIGKVSAEKAFNSDLLCEHGNLRIEPESRVLVSQEAWRRLEHYFSSPVTFQQGEVPCRTCREEREAWREETLSQRSRLENLFLDTQRPSLSQPGARKVFLVSASFVKSWRCSVMEDSVRRRRVSHVDNQSLLCVHKCFKHFLAVNTDHQHKVLVMVTQEEWDTIKEIFSVDLEVSVERVPGLGGPQLVFSPPPCSKCCDERLGEMPTYESPVTVKMIRRIGSEEKDIMVSSEMRLWQLKKKVVESFSVVPSAQKLIFNGRYLKSNNSALWQFNISPGSFIFLLVEEFIILELDDAGDNNEHLAEETGFKGTGLTSS